MVVERGSLGSAGLDYFAVASAGGFGQVDEGVHCSPIQTRSRGNIMSFIQKVWTLVSSNMNSIPSPGGKLARPGRPRARAARLSATSTLKVVSPMRTVGPAGGSAVGETTGPVAVFDGVSAGFPVAGGVAELPELPQARVTPTRKKTTTCCHRLPLNRLASIAWNVCRSRR